MEEFEPGKLILLVIMVTTSFFNTFMGASLNIALPQIAQEFSISVSHLSWLAMSFLLSLAMFLLPAGNMGDMFGRRKIFLAGNIVFLIASILCVCASSITFLVIMRFLQGLGSAMIQGTGMAIIVASFPPRNRGKIIGFNVSAVYLGLTLAPIFGGILTESYGWRMLFYVNIIASSLIITLTFLKTKADNVEPSSIDFDWRGVFLYMATMLALVVGFSGLPHYYGFVMSMVSVVLLVFFIYVEMCAVNPLLPLKLFKQNKTFLYSNMSALIMYLATFAITFIMSLYLQYTKGMSPREAGSIMVAQPVMMVIVSALSGRMSDKYQPRVLASLGLLFVVVGLVMLVFLTGATRLSYIALSLSTIGFGFGLFSSPNTNAIMGSVEKKYLGMASALSGTMRITGQLLSMAMAALVLNVVVGNVTLSASNASLLVRSSQVIFITCSVLCVLAVVTSFLGRNISFSKKSHGN